MVVHSDEIVTGRVIQVLKCLKPSCQIICHTETSAVSIPRGIRESGWTRPKQKATTTPFTQVCHLGVKRMVVVFFSTHQKKNNEYVIEFTTWLGLLKKKTLGVPDRKEEMLLQSRWQHWPQWVPRLLSHLRQQKITGSNWVSLVFHGFHYWNCLGYTEIPTGPTPYANFTTQTKLPTILSAFCYVVRKNWSWNQENGDWTWLSHKKNMETAVRPMIFSALTVSQKLNATGMRFRGTSIGGSILAVHPYTSLSIDRPTYLAVYPILSYRIELNQIESNWIEYYPIPSINPSIYSI